MISKVSWQDLSCHIKLYLTYIISGKIIYDLVGIIARYTMLYLAYILHKLLTYDYSRSFKDLLMSI